jgi:hypothetical protein
MKKKRGNKRTGGVTLVVGRGSSADTVTVDSTTKAVHVHGHIGVLRAHRDVEVCIFPGGSIGRFGDLQRLVVSDHAGVSLVAKACP